jgi:hypothetical protein
MPQLPIISYKKKRYYVDFRLEELREFRTAKPLKFTDMKEGKDSEIKKKLRGIRFRTWRQEYIAGLDD